MPKKYKVVDFYGDYEFGFNTIEEAEQAVIRLTAKTEGKCDIVTFVWSEIYQAYTSMRRELNKHGNDRIRNLRNV